MDAHRESSYVTCYPGLASVTRTAIRVKVGVQYCPDDIVADNAHVARTPLSLCHVDEPRCASIATSIFRSLQRDFGDLVRDLDRDDVDKCEIVLKTMGKEDCDFH